MRFKFLPGLLRNSLQAVFLNLVLFAWSPYARAQDLVAEKPEGSISGSVLTQGSNHLDGQVAVSLRSHDAGIFRSVLTDYDGRFEVRGLPPGTYEISVEEQGYEPFRSMARLDGPSLKVVLRLIATPSPRNLHNAYTVSVRDLQIPRKAKEEYKKGSESLTKKDLAASLNHFTKASELFPGYYEAFYHQGVVETYLGQLDNAMKAFQTAINLSDGHYAWAQFGVAYVLYLQGKAGEAETVVRKALELDPNSPDGYVILGMALLRLNRLDEAEKSAREALLRNPNFPDAYLVLADTFARRRNYQEQIQSLDTYLKLAPSGLASQRVHQARETALGLLAKAQPQN